MKKKRIAIHKHVAGCKIYEYAIGDYKRTFTANIFGWNHFGFTGHALLPQEIFTKVTCQVTEIRNALRGKTNDEQRIILEEYPQLYTFE